jgi:succinoglycan biosynthesis transport protein ExoP
MTSSSCQSGYSRNNYMEPNNSPFSVPNGPGPATGSPYGQVNGTQPPMTSSPFGATASPFGTTAAPFGTTAAPFGVTNNPFGPGVQGGRNTTASSDDFTFKEVFEVISHGILIIKSKWYWGLAGALVVGGAIGYVLFSRAAEVTAETNLLATSTLDQVLGTQADATQSDQARENDLRNHLSMMTSRRFRAQLSAAFTPEEKAQIAAPYLKKGQTADDDFFQDFFDGKIAIEREKGREYYTISVSHTVPAVAVMVADRMASEYLRYVQQQYKDANVEGYTALEKQAEVIRADIAQIENARLDYQKKNGIISRADNAGLMSDRLKHLDSSLTDIRVKRIGLATVDQQAHADRAKSEYPWDNSYLATYANNPDLHKELDDQVAQRAVLAVRYGPNHPKMRNADSQIQGIQSSIRHNFDVAVGDLDSQLQVATQTELLLKHEFDEAFDASVELEKLASTYEILSAGVDSKKITLEDIEKKIGEASVSSKLPTDFMQIVDPAYIAKHRIPKPVIFGLITAFMAIGAFLGTPLLASALDERISGTSDLEKELGVSVVGAIPTLKLRAEDRAHVVRNKVDLVTAEAFVGIVGNLEIGSTQRYPKVTLVTSTLPNEGKSLITSNLASTFRQLGKRVILIDLDLRRPVQQGLQGVSMERGFLYWAQLGFPMDSILDPNGPLGIKTLSDGKDLITSGGVEQQPSQYFVSDAVERLVNTLKSVYDVVLLDTPPAGVFQDAIMLARLSTERMLVAREGIAPVTQVKKVIEDFAKTGFPFQGVVLNGFIPRSANKKLAYGYKAASKGYQYGEKPGASPKKPKPGKEAKPIKAVALQKV